MIASPNSDNWEPREETRFQDLAEITIKLSAF